MRATLLPDISTDELYSFDSRLYAMSISNAPSPQPIAYCMQQ